MYVHSTKVLASIDKVSIRAHTHADTLKRGSIFKKNRVYLYLYVCSSSRATVCVVRAARVVRTHCVCRVRTTHTTHTDSPVRTHTQT